MPTSFIPAGSGVFLFSIDYEDVRGELVGGWSNPDRLPATTAWYLRFLASHAVRTTFFVSGETAERHPELIGDIVAAGHEIGCHGWEHVPLERSAPARFKADVAKSLDALHAAGAPRVVGFRAPYLSLTERCAWAYEVLAELGFLYSSSVLPGRNPLYGWEGFGTSITSVAGVYELPVSVATWMGVSLPFVSGASFRALPWFIVRRLCARWKHGRGPLIGYFHPQDIDVEQAKLRYADYGVIGNLVLRCNRRRVLEHTAEIFADGWRVMPYVEFVEHAVGAARTPTDAIAVALR